MGSTRTVFLLFCILAVLGFAASATVHLASLIGHLFTAQGVPVFLHVGVFIVGAPLIAIAAYFSLVEKCDDVVAHFFRALPKQLRWVGYAISLYGILTFVYMLIPVSNTDTSEVSRAAGAQAFSAA